MYLFRDLVIIYYILALAGGFLILRMEPVIGAFWLRCVVALVWVLGSALIFNGIASRRLTGLIRLRVSELRTREFLTKIEKIDDRRPMSFRHWVASVYKAAALMDLGDYNGAERVLINGEPQGEKQRAVFLRISWLELKAVCLTNLGRFAEAQGIMRESESIISRIPNGDQRVNLMYSHDNSRFIYNLKKGNIDRQEEFWLKRHREAEYMLEDVSAVYHLAEVYELKGEKEERELCLRYVAGTKGDLYMISKAREMLSSIEDESGVPSKTD